MPCNHSRFVRRVVAAGVIAGLAPLFAQAPPKADRVVILKVDGLPAGFLERFVQPESPAGARLPWIRRVFFDNGVHFENFYVRGLSLSASSWSLLDTGRHLEIRGNVEYDRYTLRAMDYLNFFPFYLGYATSRRTDMAGVELLDELGIPLLIDRFPFDQRFQSFQLFQRGVRWTTLKNSLTGTFRRHPKELFDEWLTGLSMSSSLSRQTERELLERLQDPRVRYLDYFIGDYDHAAHLSNDRVVQLHAVEDIDDFVGRLWINISKSPYPNSTLLILVSDHGMNTADGVYSQGYSLVDWFASSAGGGHHVLTNRHPLTEFKLKGLDPFVSEVITPSAAPTYLEGQGAVYPTVMLDLDGNERANIGLRNNTFNQLQILLDQLTRKRLNGPLRNAVLSAFFEIRDAARPHWERDLADLEDQLKALEARIAAEPALTAADLKKRKWTPEQKRLGLDQAARRQVRRLEAWREEKTSYSEYITVLRRLLALTPADFDPGKFKLETLIPTKSLGPLNALEDLANYVTGPAEAGMVLAADGSLDRQTSFRRINYLDALVQLRVRNNVQNALSNRPIDFLALRIDKSRLPQAAYDAIWLYRDATHQAVIESRRNDDGVLEMRYTPVARVNTSANIVSWDPADGQPGLPLELWEDPALKVSGDRHAWLAEWHTAREWFDATHATRYTNGMVGLTEQLLDLRTPPSGSTPFLDYLERKRQLRRADILVFARDHWNFNVRGFNPGGNHGALFEPSTHSVLLMTGAGLPAHTTITRPYDSLSFLPTVLRLMGLPEPDLPGEVVTELVH